MTLYQSSESFSRSENPLTSSAPVYANRKKSNKGLIFFIVAVATILVCGGISVLAVVFGNGGKPTAATPDAPGQPGVQAVGVNQPAKDGKFQFTVTSVECGSAQVGNEFLNQKAQGQYCLVRMFVANIGNEAKMFDASNQYAFNGSGQKYSADSAASVYLDDSNSFLTNINPGNSVNGIIVFDIPKGQQITKLELHDSAFSGGVTVTVAT
jgi:hypothetical protein